MNLRGKVVKNAIIGTSRVTIEFGDGSSLHISMETRDTRADLGGMNLRPQVLDAIYRGP